MECSMTDARRLLRRAWLCLGAGILALPVTYGIMFLISGPDLFLLPAAVVLATPLTFVLITVAIYLFFTARKARLERPAQVV